MSILRYFVVYAVLSLTFVSAQDKSQGFVVAVRGPVLCNLHPVVIGQMLRTSDRLTVSEGSSVDVVTELGEVRTVTSSGFFIVEPGQQARLAAWFSQADAVTSWMISAGNQLPAVRSGGEAVTLIYPRNTCLRSRPSELKWRANIEGPFECSIRAYEEEFYYDSRVTSSQMDISNEPDLTRGMRYSWYVRSERMDFSSISPAVWFLVMPEERMAEFDRDVRLLNEVLKDVDSPIAKKLLYSNLLLQYELHDEALATLDSILAVDPSNSVAHTYRAMICERMDLPDQAAVSIKLAHQTRP